MLRAYNYCYYGNKDRSFYVNVINAVFESMRGGSNVNFGNVGTKDVEVLLPNIYIPLETITRESSELYDTYKVTIPISSEICQRKTIRQVLISLQRTTYMRDYQADPSQSILNDAVRVAKVMHLLPSEKGVAGVNYKTRQGFGFTIDLPVIGWRKRYAIVEKPYAMDKNLANVINDSYNYDSGCEIEGEFYSGEEANPILGWYKRDFIVSDFSKEMFSFIQDNDYWLFLIRVNKRNLKSKLSMLVNKYGIDVNSPVYKIFSPLTEDIFGSVLYYPKRQLADSEVVIPDFRTVIVSVASIVVNILVEE